MKRNGNKNTWTKVTSKSAIIRGNNAPNAKPGNNLELQGSVRKNKKGHKKVHLEL